MARGQRCRSGAVYFVFVCVFLSQKEIRFLCVIWAGLELGDLPSSASGSAGIKGTCHHLQVLLGIF